MARRILVVEDDPMNLKLVRTLLRLEGHEVLEAVSGEQALLRAECDVPDLILMDIRLPGIDGLQACMQLKQDPQTASVPVVALTSCAMPGDERKALAAGCVGYITKPIDTQSFGNTIEGFLV